MPLTPFHLGIGLFVGFVFYRWLDFPTLCIATIIVDTRAILIVFGPLEGSLHGPLHTVLGGTFLACALAVVMFATKPAWNQVCALVGLAQKRSAYRIGAASLIGVYSHLILDAMMHADMQPLYPFSVNPLLGLVSTSDIYLVCFLGFLFGVIFYMAHLYYRVESLANITLNQ